MKNVFNIKSYLTFLSRNKLYAAINVFGLSISLAFVILIGLYAYGELSMDRMHSKADRTYVLGFSEKDSGNNDYYYTGSNWNIQKYLNGHYPEIEKTCGICAQKNLVDLPSGDKIHINELCVDSTFYSIFDFKLLEGDPMTVFDSRDNVVVTESFSKKFFGNDDPVGKTISIKGKRRNVAGLAKDMKHSCIGKDCDVIERFENVRNLSLRWNGLDNATGSEVVILAKKGTDLPSKAEQMKEYFKTFFWFYQDKDCAESVELIPLTKLYYSNTKSSAMTTDRGNLMLLKILIAVGLVILLFSIINYVNLTIAQSGYRAKEMATRRLLGSKRGEIVAKLVCESVFLCLVSLAIGLVLAWAACPYAAHILDSQMAISDLFAGSGFVIVIVVALLIGSIAGIAPAVFISRAKPIEVVRGTFRLRTKMVFSKFFIVFQNVMTITMIAVALTMFLQTQHLIHAPLGFNTKNIIEISDAGDSSQTFAFVNELEAQSCVSAVSCNFGTPKDGGNNNTVDFDGKTVSMQTIGGDQNFFKIYEIKLIKDNNVSDPYGIYVNDELLCQLGLDRNAKIANIQSMKYGGDRRMIRGVFQDFHLRNIMTSSQATIIMVADRKYLQDIWGFSILLQGDPVRGYDTVKSIYKKVFHQELDEDHPFVDQAIASEYESEKKMSTIVGLFAGIAILISLLGLIAMSTYYIQQRSKEIAVRKVFGSTGKQVTAKLVRSFLMYVAIAFVIAVPIIWYFMGNWLTNYSYRIKLSPWIFIAAGAFTLLISFLAVLSQSLKAANADPIDDIVEKE
jgi:putative ABC transport system permease protein